MSVKILFFAQASVWAGRKELACELNGSSTVSDLLGRAELRGLQGKLQGTRFAVNRAFAAADARVEDGDEVAVLPPVSGG